MFGTGGADRDLDEDGDDDELDAPVGVAFPVVHAVAIMPSAFESLSIFVLEAWAHGTPVLVNAKCKVLEGQCRRSQGGLYYRDLAEFAAMMRLLISQPALREQLGAAGRDYVQREYSWEIAAARTNELLRSL